MHACRNGFTLHGLWPNLDNACPEDFPEHCIARRSSFEPLDMGSLNQTVLDGLKNNWISYTSCARTTLTLYAPCLVQTLPAPTPQRWHPV
jgi:ribonuclease I